MTGVHSSDKYIEWFSSAYDIYKVLPQFQHPLGTRYVSFNCMASVFSMTSHLSLPSSVVLFFSENPFMLEGSPDYKLITDCLIARTPSNQM